MCFIRSKHFRRLTALLCTLAPTLAPAVLAAEPVATENINDQDDRTIQIKGEFSFLYANGSGGVTHAEHLRSGKILVEDYDASFRCLSSRTLPGERPIWGGFSAGGKYHFVFTAQRNMEERDAKEVFRATKYSRDWQRLDGASISGADTCGPGSVGRMAEGNGSLYVHTD